VFVLTAIGVYLLVLSQSHEESVAFVVMMMGMYAVMMTVTLILKH
jgi:inner membrane protein involved in colicin E2 resistance